MAMAGRIEQGGDAAASDETIATQSLTDVKHGGACTSFAVEGGLAKSSGDDVQHSPAPNEETFSTQNTMAKVGPPVAPASFFGTFETSHHALEIPIKDLCILCCLVVVVAILCRACSIQYAKLVG